MEEIKNRFAKGKVRCDKEWTKESRKTYIKYPKTHQISSVINAVITC